MMYQGGKARIAKPIADILLRAKHTDAAYIEPFLGSAAVFHLVAPHYDFALGTDSMPDLIMLWEAASQGWEPPEDLSLEEYNGLRDEEPSPLRAFAGFPCSFGGKWFGGYARDRDLAHNRNFARTASRSIVRRSNAMRGAMFQRANYEQLTPLMGPGTLVYCDPPYANTTGYAGAEPFDSYRFWEVAAYWSAKGAHVLVSEYAAPEGWLEVWSAKRHVSTALHNDGATATDRLFALPFTAEALGLYPAKH